MKKQPKLSFNNLTLISIFFANLWVLGSLIMAIIIPHELYSENQNPYSTIWAPLFGNLVQVVLARLLRKRAQRVKSCALTKLAAYLFSALTGFSLIYLIFGNLVYIPYSWFLVFIQGLVAVSIFLMITFYLLRVCLQKYGR